SVRKFHSSEYLNALASGEICLVVGFSGDVKQSQKRAAEARNGVEIAYAIPKEGTQLWFDNLAIPRDAKNVAEAHEFINFLQKPEVAAKNSNFISYANGNLASQKFIDKAILDDKTIYPDAAVMDRFYTIDAHDPKTERPMNPLWTRIKTGRRARPPRQRRCTQSHCSGCSRTQPSTTEVMTCMVPSMSTLPSASRRGSIASVMSMRKRWRSGRRTTRVPWIGHSTWRARRAMNGLALQRR